MKRKQTDLRVGLPCLRCGTELLYAGNFKFHEGTRWGALGDIFELNENRECFDVCKCPNCGKVEFYDMKIKNNRADGKSDS
jgi:predicted nucleic-acid-binding Zn-ribbon protein